MTQQKHYLLARGGLLCGEVANISKPNYTGSPFRVTCEECVLLLAERMAVKS